MITERRTIKGSLFRRRERGMIVSWKLAFSLRRKGLDDVACLVLSGEDSLTKNGLVKRKNVGKRQTTRWWDDEDHHHLLHSEFHHHKPHKTPSTKQQLSNLLRGVVVVVCRSRSNKEDSLLPFVLSIYHIFSLLHSFHHLENTEQKEGRWSVLIVLLLHLSPNRKGKRKSQNHNTHIIWMEERDFHWWKIE